MNGLPKLNLPEFDFKLDETDVEKKIFCAFRKKWVLLKPEEWVRQNFARYMTDYLRYPSGRIKLEQPLKFSGRYYSADIVFYDKDLRVSLIVECKRPEVKITQDTFRQIGIYNNALGGTDYLMITNGKDHYALQFEQESNSYKFLPELPAHL